MALIDNEIGKTITNASAKVVDESLNKSADFARKAGLEVRVTRVYDGRGLHGGKDTCDWCKSRECHNVTLEEAYRIGAFQRHEGCECIIEYTSAKGDKTIQTGKYNGWNFAEELEKRKTIGLNEEFFAEELLSRVKQYTGINVSDLYNTAKTGGLYKSTLDSADLLAKPDLEKSIKSHIQRTEEHEWKIQNPEKYSERYRNGNAQTKQNVLHEWEDHRRKHARAAALKIKLWEEKFK